MDWTTREDWLEYVEGIVEDAIDSVESDPWDFRDELIEYVEQGADGSRYSVYYSDARRLVLDGLECDERDWAYEEGHDLHSPSNSFDQLLCIMAYSATRTKAVEMLENRLEELEDAAIEAEIEAEEARIEGW